MRELVFLEEQRFRQWWLWLIVIAVVAFVVNAILNSGQSGPWRIFLFIAVTFGLPLLMFTMRLLTKVGYDELELEFVPLWTRTIPVADIVTCEALTYRPLLHYGGWGIRYSLGRGWAYNVSGKQGVLLKLLKGKPVLVGSRRASDLESAVRAVMGASPRK